MRRSRLKLFKATSMTISLIGVIMIVVTIGFLAYLGFWAISNTITSDAGSGTYYDKLAVLKSDYNNLSSQYDSTQLLVNKRNDKNLTTEYDNAKIELIQAQSDISDVESAITTKKSPEEIQARIDTAQQQLQKASDSLNSLRAKLSS